ncbi:hypothetical protein SMKC081_46680 (plasmid) [Serratia marcescens]|nr:hypothetical protein SMKC081_46680 [Serratia marcescens]
MLCQKQLTEVLNVVFSGVIVTCYWRHYLPNFIAII